MSLSLQSIPKGPVTIIRCSGRIVSGNETATFESEIRRSLDQSATVVLNLSEITFIDSSGLGLLVRLHTTSRTLGRSFTICCVPESVLAVFALTKLDRVLDLHPSEGNAIAAGTSHSMAPGKPQPGGASILCVHGSLNLLASIRESLSQAGYDVHITASLEDAILIMERHRPRLLIASPRTLTTLNQRANQLGIPVVPLKDDFASTDAGQAISDLLELVINSL